MSEAVDSLLQRVYSEIQWQRMQNVPLLNPRLSVQAVGFRPHGEGWVGVLLTPWCMNLLMLPGQADWSGLKLGQERFYRFPGGGYRFIVGEEPALGRFQSCSLFSPMFEFPDQSTAVAVAEQVLEALFTPPPEPSRPALNRRAWLTGQWRRASSEPT